MANEAPGDAMYPEGRWVYRAETARWNPFVRSLQSARVLSALKLPIFRVRAPAGYGVLETTGRMTGRVRRKCMRVIRDGDTAYLVAIGGGNAAWVKNIEANAAVRLRVNNEWVSGTATEIEDPTDLATARKVYCETVTRFDFMTCRVHRRGLPTRAKIIELTSAWFDHGLPLAIQIDGHR